MIGWWQYRQPIRSQVWKSLSFLNHPLYQSHEVNLRFQGIHLGSYCSYWLFVLYQHGLVGLFHKHKDITYLIHANDLHGVLKFCSIWFVRTVLVYTRYWSKENYEKKLQLVMESVSKDRLPLVEPIPRMIWKHREDQVGQQNLCLKKVREDQMPRMFFEWFRPGLFLNESIDWFICLSLIINHL